jgi:hypothetical protein
MELKMGDGGKGSKPRPFSVSRDEYANNFENIFGKKDKNMQVRVTTDDASFGKCGCGRSPTGKCIGWHGLNEEQLVEAKRVWDLEEYKKQAQGLWNDSCTSGRAE